MKTKTSIEITDWPVLPVKETNRQRIIRALREADGVVPQGSGRYSSGDKRCGMGVVIDALFGGDYLRASKFVNRQGRPDGALPGTIQAWNDGERLTFREIADRLDSDEFWGEYADEEFKP